MNLNTNLTTQFKTFTQEVKKKKKTTKKTGSEDKWRNEGKIISTWKNICKTQSVFN